MSSPRAPLRVAPGALIQLLESAITVCTEVPEVHEHGLYAKPVVITSYVPSSNVNKLRQSGVSSEVNNEHFCPIQCTRLPHMHIVSEATKQHQEKCMPLSGHFSDLTETRPAFPSFSVFSSRMFRR